MSDESIPRVPPVQASSSARDKLEGEREVILDEMAALETKLQNMAPQARRMAIAEKRLWSQLRLEGRRLGVPISEIDWGDGTGSKDYPVDVAP